MVKPNPVPPYSRVVELSACVNALNTFSCRSLGIPIPSSSILIFKLWLLYEISRIIFLFSFVNLIALSNKFEITCLIRKESLWRYWGTFSSIFKAKSIFLSESFVSNKYEIVLT